MDEELLCPHCGAEVPAESRFCPHCGERLASEERPTCPHCGAEVPTGSRFCPHCGGALEEGAEPARPKPKRVKRPGIGEQIKTKGFFNWALDTLGSIRLTIPLLAILTIAAAIGGVVPQAPITPNADLLYRSYGRFWHNIIKFFLLDDVFHSWWFLTLMGLFSINLVVCTARRLRRSVRLLATPLRPLSQVSAAGAATASFRGRILEEVREAARHVLKRRHLRFREEGEQLFGERWRWS
ncbi:MAG: cytochrome c biogenesis protein ResB, partial [Candidatus Bipolaricaulia bacterium]